MKKKLLLVITFILIVITLIALYSQSNQTPPLAQYRPELDIVDKKILAEKSYSNFAWGVQYTTSIIFDDGTIFTWNFSGSLNDYPFFTNDSKEYRKNYILENGTKESKKVPITDLEFMENFIESLEDSIKIKYPGTDQGTSCTSVWNSNGTEIKLRLSGDAEGKNKEKNAKKILEIIDNYI